MRSLSLVVAVIVVGCAPAAEDAATPLATTRQAVATIMTVVQGRPNEALGMSLDWCGGALAAGSSDRAWVSDAGFTSTLTGGPYQVLCFPPDAGGPWPGQLVAANSSVFAHFAAPSWVQVNAVPPIAAVARSDLNDVAVMTGTGIVFFPGDGAPSRTLLAQVDAIDLAFVPVRPQQGLWALDVNNKLYLVDTSSGQVTKTIALVGDTPHALELGDFLPATPGDELAVLTSSGVDFYGETNPTPVAPLVHHAISNLDGTGALRRTRFGAVDTLLVGDTVNDRVHRLVGTEGYVVYQSQDAEAFGAAVVELGNQLFVGAPKAGLNQEGRIAVVTGAEDRPVVALTCVAGDPCDTTCGMGTCLGGVVCRLPFGTPCVNGMPLDGGIPARDAGVDAGSDAGTVPARDAGLMLDGGGDDAGVDAGTTDAGLLPDPNGVFVFPVGCSAAPLPLAFALVALLARRRRGAR